MTNIAFPQCFVEIYPFEGQTFFFSGKQILSCTTHRDIHDDVGNFTIVLPPGGPNGTNLAPSWSEVLTPSSLCLIGMVCDGHSEVVMVGVVTGANETQHWSNSGVQRVTEIIGEDMAHFFMQQNWANLTVLAGTGASAAGEAINIPEAGLAAILGAGYLNGPPSEIASNWYNSILDGGQGILSQTKFPFGGGNAAQGQAPYINFSDAVAQFFEEYPNFIIPFGDFFFQSEGNWLEKFRQMLPFPWYECYLTTLPAGSIGTGGFAFTMKGIEGSSTPTFVCRINPIPVVTVNGDGTFDDLDSSRWDQLPGYVPETGFYQSDVNFNTNEVRNFYVLNPTWMRRMFGDTNSGLNPYIFSFLAYIDIASVHRYGYVPEIANVSWLTDTTGAHAKSGQTDVTKLVADLTGRLFSQYEPTPLMANGMVKYRLRPDIFPGGRFSYAPFKNDVTWDFYLTGVTHTFVFDHEASTTLTLTRGLPSSVYDDDSLSGILGQAHVGNAMRVDGVYKVGLPPGIGSPLQSIDLSKNAAAQWLSQLAPIATKAQGGQ